jgi:cell division protein FtsI (penicillin-binding protein 3)
MEKNGTYKEKYNYAIGETSEPGSTFKLASIIVALEDGVININDSINVEGGIKKYYKQTMRDSHLGEKNMTIRQAFEKSSNVGISKIIYENYKTNPKRYVERLYQLNLNQKLDLSIIGEGVPYIKYPGDDGWSGVTLPWMAIGYEVRLTPLQILALYNSIANDGVMVKPQFLDKILFHGDVVDEFKTKVINPAICSDKTLKIVKELLEGVVKEGTARNIHNDNYKIAGKTGTAQIAHSTGGYTNKEGRRDYKASFVGYFPADNPKYSCIVVVTRPKKLYYGNQVAGPVFKEVADKIYSTSLDMINYDNQYFADVPYSRAADKYDLQKVLSELNIKYEAVKIESDWVKTEKKDSLIKFHNMPYVNSSKLVPNVKGMGAKDVLYLLENKGLRVTLNGIGSVVWQSIPAGTEFYKGQKIIVELG